MGFGRVGITDGRMDLLPEYIEGTGCNSHRKVARLPTFKNFSSKCLEYQNVALEPSLFYSQILSIFCLILGFSKENEILGIFQE